MTGDLLTLLVDDWLLGAIAIFALLASVVLVACVYYVGCDVRSVVKAQPGSLWPDGEEEHLPVPWPLDRGISHAQAPFRAEHKGTVVNMRARRP